MSIFVRKKSKIKSLLLNLFIFIFIITSLYITNLKLGTKKVDIIFFDEQIENQSIQHFVSNLVLSKSKTLLGFLLLDENEITRIVHNEYELVDSVKISKKINGTLSVAITKNEEYFYTCVGEELGFLTRCMKGNTDGVFFAELINTESLDLASSSEKGYRIEINPKVLYDAKTQKKLDKPDSLSSARIYKNDDFIVLRELVNWVEKNGFEIQKIYIDDLKIVTIFTSIYDIKMSLEKGYIDTVKDFDLISRTGNLKNYINEKKDEINYIDLSYKDKVFYKLNKDVELITSTSTEFLLENSTSSSR